jgi:hypothetical protein
MNKVNRINRIVCLVLVICLFAAVLCSCGDRLKNVDAKKTFAEFLEAVESEDYEEAEEYLHPSYPGVLDLVFEMIEIREGIDFQKSIDIEKFSSTSYSYYDSKYDGSQCSFKVKAKVSGVAVIIEATVVDNDSGYGVYDFVVYKR